MTTCVICDQPAEPTAYACQRCATRTGTLLAQAADLAADADDAAAGLMRHGTGGRRGGEHPMPGRPDLRARLDAATTTLTTWARHVADERGHTPPAPGRHPGGTAAAWLVGHLDWLRHQPYAGEALADLAGAARDVIRTADRPPERAIVGACECGAVLYAIAGADVVRCRSCGARWDVEASRATLLRHVEDQLLSAAQIAHLAARAGHDRQRVRNLIAVWARRGVIKPAYRDDRGVPLYRLGDVLDRLDAAATPALAAAG
ncbi:hypothetical protein [Micromonospora sp. HM5-17]|uniref:hypothetical protein n=1 Tax=Micromonospora sp. HM5-17 TaxID=2487710 RepID=UPI000F47D134|nr:hypothetical protein [Micromonospora sp. HM5-17]ROT29676.1 hypothetical protein EF879_18710 [Micromonospora sp. HM5-17]